MSRSLICIDDDYRDANDLGSPSRKGFLVPEETSIGDSSSGKTASDRYEVVVTKGPALARGLRWVGTLIWGIVSQGDVVHPGGDTIIVRDRRSTEPVATFVQSFGGGIDMAAHLKNELSTLTIEEFEVRWLTES